MSDPRAEQPKRSWRGKQPTPAPPVKPKTTHGWNRVRRGDAPVEKETGFRRYRIIAAVSGLLALTLGTMVALLFWLQRPDSVALVLVGADYATNLALPHNAAGWQGLRSLEDVAKTPTGFSLLPPPSLRLRLGPVSLDSAKGWDDLIARLGKSEPREEVVLFVLSLHGGADANGAYLLPDLANGPGERIALGRVIESVGALYPTRKKVLVLEAAHVPTDWRQGMLTNRFAAELERLEGTIRKTPNLWVLSASDVGQRCWASEGLGQSVFMHYLAEAFRGKIDGQRRVFSLDDLHKYLKTQVSNWVWNSRHAIQEPVLYPKGSESGRSARAVPLAAKPKAADFAKPPAFDRSRVQSEWLRFQRVDRARPHPATYSPRAWREFRATLIRVEMLARAGASEQAGVLASRLDALERRMEADRLLSKPLTASVENSLVMRALRGEPAEPASPPVRPEFGAFWNAASEVDADREWDAMRKAGEAAADAAPNGSLRIRMDHDLLTRAAKDPSRDLARAASRLGTTRTAEYPQPAEAHFARMVDRFLDPKDKARADQPAFWRALAGGLSVRVAAERAALAIPDDPAPRYHHVEEVQPWVRPLIDSADAARRRGEDLLFSSRSEDWSQAEASLGQAERGYRDVLGRAEALRSAYAVRDRVLSELPDFTHWVPRRPPAELEDDLADKVEALWQATHALSEALETPRPETNPTALGTQAAEVEKGFDEVLARFDAQRAHATGPRPDEDPSADAVALAVPFRDTEALDFRAALWDRMKNLGDGDVERYRKPLARTPTAKERHESRRVEQLRAKLEGRMALAVLGRRWFDDAEVFPGSTSGDFQGTLERVQRVEPEPEGEDEDEDEDTAREWGKELLLAGERIGQRWRAVDGEIRAKLGDRDEIPENLGDFQKRLVKAERLARMIDAGASPLRERDTESATLARMARVHDLLLWLAERTWRDHWHDEDSAGQRPYYKKAGQLFLDDAAALFPRSGAKDRERLQALLDGPGRLTIEAAGPMLLTSETAIEAGFRINAPEGFPGGTPVVRPKAAKLVKLSAESADYRPVPLREPGSPSDRPSTFQFGVTGPEAAAVPRSPGANIGEVAAELYFRGETEVSPAPVEVHPQPEVVAVGTGVPDPPEAMLTVVADPAIVRRFGAGTGSLAIVLDCSGSMGDDSDTRQRFQINRRSRFHEARDALQALLDEVPEGTNLSLLTFGQARDGLVDKKFFIPEDELQRNDPRRTIQRLRPAAPWQRTQKAELMQRIDDLWPFHGTPLIEAMIRARSEFTRPAGLKTLLVLTDGNDSEYLKPEAPGAGAAGADPRRDRIHDYLRKAFAGLGIEVNIVFYGVAAQESERARSNFEVVRTLDPPGHDYQTKDFQALKQALARAMRQQITWTVAGESANAGALTVDPRRLGEWWPIGLSPGAYTLSVMAEGTRKQDLTLGIGDRLIVQLVEENGRLAFRRGLYGEKAPVAAEAGGWKLSFHGASCQNPQGDEMRTLVALEAMGGDGPRLRQIRPRFAWFDLAPLGAGDGPPDYFLRWRERAYYPGPVWQFDVPHWVAGEANGAPAPLELGAWWSADGPTPSARVDLGELASPQAIDHQEVALDDGRSVVVESIRIEDQRVERRPGEPPEVEPCLVLRMDYRKAGGPVVVDPEAIRVAVGSVGHEHRLYMRARKYTGVFWPVTTDQVAKLKSLPLISLPSARAEAAATRRAVQGLRLGRPGVKAALPAPIDLSLGTR